MLRNCFRMLFLTIYNSASVYRSESKVSTWVYRISVNKSLDFLRRKTARNDLESSALLSKRYWGNPVWSSGFYASRSEIGKSGGSEILFQVIDSLSENQKTAFILTQIEDLPQQEVGEIMKITRKAVESLVQRAKANLKKWVRKKYPNRGI